jgi:hypothetical protein
MPLKEHSENILHTLIGLTMHAISVDETPKPQTSSIHNSSIKCPIGKRHAIPESPLPTPQQPSNQKVKKVNRKKSDLKVNHNTLKPNPKTQTLNPKP